MGKLQNYYQHVKGLITGHLSTKIKGLEEDQEAINETLSHTQKKSLEAEQAVNEIREHTEHLSSNDDLRTYAYLAEVTIACIALIFLTVYIIKRMK